MKKVLTFFLLLFFLIQFYRPYKNTTQSTQENNFLIRENVPQKIASIIKKSCYDCHSNNTEYKWYDNIAPLSWYVDTKIKRAKFSLNFSEWGSFEAWQRRLFLQGAIIYDINIDRMPPKNYLTMHSDAKISLQEKKEIELWIRSIDFTKE